MSFSVRQSVQRRALVLLAACWLLATASGVGAIGWDNDDFIITGAPNFPQYIGIFDHDFTFKGYLDQNFLGVQGMDFDAQGNLVAASNLNAEVRVYSPNGTKIGGFTQANSPMLVTGGGIKVAPNGDFLVGTLVNGAREFSPQGGFVRQYGDGNSVGITYVPGDRLWIGGSGNTVRVFDTTSGSQAGTFTADQQLNAHLMQFGPATGTVLIVDQDRDAGGVFERDLNGVLLRQFHVPLSQVGTRGATRGPNGDVFGTTSDLTSDVVRWRSDGSVAATYSVYPFDVHQVNILWAGVVPEPESMGLVIIMFAASRAMRARHR